MSLDLTALIDIIIFYFPLSLLGLWRWGVWLFKFITSSRYKPVESNGYKATLSIVTPVYNEDPKIFREALESWRDNDPDEIIAVIDYSDKRCIEEFKKFQRKFKKARLIITEKPGKRPALADGIRASKGDIVALVDSDTIWERGMKDKLLAPFKDEEIWAVAPRQLLYNPKNIWQKTFELFWGHRFLVDHRGLCAKSRALTCVSGRTAVYRRDKLLEVLPEMENEKFLGQPVISGEDKALTREIQRRGGKVAYQENAIVYSVVATSFLTFLKQQIRWSRNSWRSDIISLKQKWPFRKPYFFYFAYFGLIDRFIQPFTLLVSLAYLIYTTIAGYWIALTAFVIFLLISRTIKNIRYFREKKSRIIFVPMYIVMQYLMAFVRIYALMTVNIQGWITRWSKDRRKLKKINTIQTISGAVGSIAVFIIIFMFVAIF